MWAKKTLFPGIVVCQCIASTSRAPSKSHPSLKGRTSFKVAGQGNVKLVEADGFPIASLSHAITPRYHTRTWSTKGDVGWSQGCTAAWVRKPSRMGVASTLDFSWMIRRILADIDRLVVWQATVLCRNQPGQPTCVSERHRLQLGAVVFYPCQIRRMCIISVWNIKRFLSSCACESQN